MRNLLPFARTVCMSINYPEAKALHFQCIPLCSFPCPVTFLCLKMFQKPHHELWFKCGIVHLCIVVLFGCHFAAVIPQKYLHSVIKTAPSTMMIQSKRMFAWLITSWYNLIYQRSIYKQSFTSYKSIHDTPNNKWYDWLIQCHVNIINTAVSYIYVMHISSQLTHLPLVPHKGVSESGQHWFR